MSSSLGVFVSADELALEAGVSVRTVQSWAKAGYFSKEGTNSYDLLGYYRWRTSSLKAELSSLKGVASGWEFKWREGRARKVLAEAKLIELELLKLSQSVVLEDVVAFELEKMLSCFISSVRTFPRQVSSDLALAHSHDHINHILDAGVTAVLSQIQTGLKKLKLPPHLVEKCESFYAAYSSASFDNGSEPT